MEYQINKPYPPVTVTAPNEKYGLMILDNVGGMVSEMSAVSKYMYNYTLSKCNYPPLVEMFTALSIVEMHHLDIFMELALKLGVDPRLWSCLDDQCYYWSPSYLNYPCTLGEVLSNAIESEQAAIDKYCYQAKCIDDPYIVANLKRIIEDEQHHIKILKHWETKLVR